MHNFNTLVDLIAKCGGKQVHYQLLTAPKNANYMPHLYIGKYISIINCYFEEPLLTSLPTNKYAF